MSSHRVPAFLFVSLLMVATVFILKTSNMLPEHTASHFGGSGQANGYMTRNGYRLFMLAFGIVLPLCIVCMIGWFPRLMPQYTNIPHRTFWLAPARRAETFAALTSFALWFGCLMVLFLCSVHWLVVRANLSTPPRLAHVPFLSFLGLFLLALGGWIFRLYQHFRLPH